MTDPTLFEACATRIAFTGRLGGESGGPYASLNLSADVEDDAAAVQGNRLAVLFAFGCLHLAPALVVPRQVHGADIVTVHDVSAARASAAQGADGVVCALPEVPVLLCFADCVPVILVAPGGAFAVVHAGWRGALAGIPAVGLKCLAALAGCDAGSCNAYIGPHIGPCCYEVSDELLGRFVDSFGRACAADGALDLGAAVTASLVGAGAASERIAAAGICTSCAADRYYSYRAQGGICGRHGAFACKGGR